MLLPISSTGGILNPATLSLTQWVRSYSGAPWNGVASAGTSGSGSNDLVSTGSPPTVGASLNGYGTALFSGAETLEADGTLNTYIDNTAGSGWVLIYPNVTDGDIWVTNTLTAFGLYMQSGQVYLIHDSSDANVAISASSWQLVTWRFNASILEIGVNTIPGAAGGVSSSAISGTVDLSDVPTMGGSSIIANLDARVAELGITDSFLSNSRFNDIKSYVNVRYGLGL